MRRRRLLALLFLSAAVVTSASAATDPLQLRAHDVRSAIPSAEAYFADHGTYAGMTVAKLRRAYDRSLKNVTVGRARKKSYCIRSTLKPMVHYDGPAGPLRKGKCGVRGAVVPRPAPAPTPPPSTPEQRIRYATPAIEAYAADHGGYAGMTLQALQQYDASVTDLRIAWAFRDRYCVESGSNAVTYHRVGPAEPVMPGACPSA